MVWEMARVLDAAWGMASDVVLDAAWEMALDAELDVAWEMALDAALDVALAPRQSDERGQRMSCEVRSCGG